MSSVTFVPIRWSISDDDRSISVYGINASGNVYVRVGINPYIYIDKAYNYNTLIHVASINDIIDIDDTKAKVVCSSKLSLDKTKSILLDLGIKIVDECNQLTKFFFDNHIIPSKLITAKGLNCLPEHQLYGKKYCGFKNEYHADAICKSSKLYPDVGMTVIVVNNNGTRFDTAVYNVKYLHDSMQVIDLKVSNSYLDSKSFISYVYGYASPLIIIPTKELGFALKEEICVYPINLCIKLMNPYVSQTEENMSSYLSGMPSLSLFDSIKHALKNILDKLRKLSDFWKDDIHHLLSQSMLERVRNIATVFLDHLPFHSGLYSPYICNYEGYKRYPRAIDLDPYWKKCFLQEDKSAGKLISYFSTYPCNEPKYHLLYEGNLFKSTPLKYFDKTDFYAMSPQYAFINESACNKCSKLITIPLILCQHDSFIVINNGVKYHFGYSPLLTPVALFISKALDKYISDLLESDQDPFLNKDWFSKLDLYMSDYICSVIIDESDFDHLGGSVGLLSNVKILKKDIVTRLIAYGKGDKFSKGHCDLVNFVYALHNNKPIVLLAEEISEGQDIDYKKYEQLFHEAFRYL